MNKVELQNLVGGTAGIGICVPNETGQLWQRNVCHFRGRRRCMEDGCNAGNQRISTA